MTSPIPRFPTVATLCFALAASGCGGADATDAFSATGEVIAMSGSDGGPAHACFSCHGLAGEGDGIATPRLAGLASGYLHRQLDDYADGRRRHPAMQAIALRLDADARRKVSAHYAGMPATRSAGENAPPAAGAVLYRQGDPARGLASCASCHGAQGEGVGQGNPPLAGQPAAYVAGQLDAWRAGRRQNDASGVMLEVSRHLSPAETHAVALYAASLPARPAPAPATSPPARRGDR